MVLLPVPGIAESCRRGLREEISLLWRTSALRSERPSPLDEVRRALLFFDETLFRVTPLLYRTLDRTLDLAPWVEAQTGESGSGPASDSGSTSASIPRSSRL